MKQLYTVDFNLLLILYYHIIFVLFSLRSIATSFHNSFIFFPQSTISQTRLQMKKKKKKKRRVCPVNAARAVNVYQQGFVGSGVHGNPCKQLSPSSLFLPRPSPLSPSSISSRFSPFYCSSAAPRRANLATMAATDNYYDKITAIQQSLHERYFLRFFLVFFK